MAASLPARVTEAEFLALPESTDRIELLDGEIIMSPAPTPNHQRIVLKVATALDAWAATRSPVPFVGLSPLDVRFGPNRILQPDVFVCLQPIDANKRGPLSVIPDLCVEVLSTNRVHDRVTKRFIYTEAGVREYWVVEPAGVIEVLSGDQLSQSRMVQDVLTSPLLPGFELDVPSIFPPRG